MAAARSGQRKPCLGKPCCSLGLAARGTGPSGHRTQGNTAVSGNAGEQAQCVSSLDRARVVVATTAGSASATGVVGDSWDTHSPLGPLFWVTSHASFLGGNSWSR